MELLVALLVLTSVKSELQTGANVRTGTLDEYR
jgi:hypothetical protein